MSPRSLNKATLIGNLTRDPELRYTPQGTAVCTFGVATNRSWTTDSGEKREETEFHRIVAWNKLAELCSQLLTKGRKVYVEGRLSTRNWTGQDGVNHTTTEVIIEDMIVLDSRKPLVEGMPQGEVVTPAVGLEPSVVPDVAVASPVPAVSDDPKAAKPKKKVEEKASSSVADVVGEKIESSSAEATKDKEKTDINPSDIPF